MSQLSDRNHPEIGNLTAAQLNALSRAAQREDCALTLPDNLKGRAADRLAASLIGKGLVREVRVKAGMPVWRRDDRGSPQALIITKLGRASINADEVDEASSAGARSTKPRKARSPNTATATKPGLPRTRHGDSAKPRWDDLDEMDTSATSADQPSPEAPRPGSKLAAVLALLQGEAGSSIEELSAATGWLPHTTRAALTRLRQRGYVVERFRIDEGGSTYRIVKLTSPIAA